MKVQSSHSQCSSARGEKQRVAQRQRGDSLVNRPKDRLDCVCGKLLSNNLATNCYSVVHNKIICSGVLVFSVPLPHCRSLLTVHHLQRLYPVHVSSLISGANFTPAPALFPRIYP